MYCDKLLLRLLNDEEATYHQGMNSRVEKNKQPDWRRHISDAGPHAKHCTGMMKRLQRGAGFALGQDDCRVQDLIEL